MSFASLIAALMDNSFGFFLGDSNKKYMAVVTTNFIADYRWLFLNFAGKYHPQKKQVEPRDVISDLCGIFLEVIE